MYRINPFVHIYERDEVKALYNALNLNTLYVSKDMCDIALEKPHDQMIKEDFFVTSSFDALSYFNENVTKANDNNINIAYFLLTSVCNFKCKYCYIENRIEHHDNAFMEKEVAEKGIQFFRRNIDNDRVSTIIFYGGEPFLNFEIMKYIVNRTKELGMRLEYKVVSNGSIMNTEIVDFIKENNIVIAISVDGLENTNNLMRIDHNGNGTFTKTNETLSTFSENGVVFGLSCTISRHNMNNMDEIVTVLEKYNIKGMGYNLPSENENISFSDDEKHLIITNLMKAEDTMFDKRIFEDRVINRRLKRFVEKSAFIKDCAGYGNQIAITPKGQVGICHGLWPDEINQKAKTYFDINVDYMENVKEHPIWQEWTRRTPFNMPQCWSCEAISLCGGGCALRPFLRTGSIWNVDTDICIFMKEVMPWIVWKYFDTKVKSEFDKQTGENSG